MTGSDKLAFELDITVGGKKHAIRGGNVRTFDFKLSTFGVEGSIEFVVEDQSKAGGKSDQFLADFLKPDLMAVSIKIHGVHTDVEVHGDLKPITIGGLVARKSQTGRAFKEMKSDAILERRYRLEFVDAARLLWSQHHPCELFTKKTVQNVLDAHKGDKITLSYSWDALTVEWPMLFVGLDPTQGAANFYDFVIWFVDTRHGVLTYDQATQGYKFAAQKSVEGTAIKLVADEIASVTAQFPDVPRHQPFVINSWSEGSAKQPITQAQAATGIRQDFLIRTPIADDVKARVTLETSRIKLPKTRIQLSYSRFPTIPFTPGALVSLDVPSFWTSSTGAGEDWRVRDMHITGRAQREDTSEDYDAQSAAYDLDVIVGLEMKSEEMIHLPAYVAPTPVHIVEGKIVSENGEDADDTYQIYTDANTSLDNYKLEIPLWNKQQIAAPFEPLLSPGHFYFPAYKHERVLVGLEFQKATVLRFLDWRAGAKLPADGQGDHLLLGKTTKSNTSIRHYYDSNKPVFLMLRTNDKDTGTIQIEEGSLMLEVKENSEG